MFEFSISLSGDHIDAKTFLDAVTNAVKLLRAVEGGSAIRWRLGTLRYSSPATIGFVGEPKRRDSQYRPEYVGQTLIAGLESLEGNQSPKGFPEEALELAKKLSGLKGQGGVSNVVLTARNGDVALRTVPLTQRTAATVEDIIGTKYESLGSIEGRLEVVSSHGGIFRCNVYERTLLKAVRCDVPERLRREVLELFDREVIASGTVSRDGAGIARHIALESIRPIEREPQLPQSLAGLAPDFTEGTESVDYIKNRWK